MLPTRQQVEEKLNSLGYKLHPYNPYFHGLPHGWYTIYYHKHLDPPLRLRYLDLPEINLGPFYVLSFEADTFNMSHAGLETLRLETDLDLNKIEYFIDTTHYFYAYLQPWNYQKTKYEPKNMWWDSLPKAWQKAMMGKLVDNEKSWQEWRQKVTEGNSP